MTALTTPLAGCSSDVKGGGKEADLVSETPTKKQEVPKGSGPLWPLTPGKSWRTLTIRPKQKQIDSEIRVIGPYRVPGGRSGTLVRSYRQGKPFRVEILETDRAGNINVLALGESEQKLLVFDPPIPFLASPAQEGKYLRWNGTAKIARQTFVARAFHRISAVDSVKTPFETIRAYRLDGIVSLENGSQRVDYPVVMWFVPGKGIAQRRLADRGVLALEIITKFTP
jgi:hypothetical protein